MRSESIAVCEGDYKWYRQHGYGEPKWVRQPGGHQYDQLLAVVNMDDVGVSIRYDALGSKCKLRFNVQGMQTNA